MKIYAWAVALIFLLIPVFLSDIAASKHNSVPKLLSKVENQTSPTPKPGKAVLGVNDEVVPFYTVGSDTVKCDMPDGKTVLATKYDCDTVKKFWNDHKPSNPGPVVASSNSGSNSSNSGDKPASTPTPTPTVEPTATPTVTPTPTNIPTPTPTRAPVPTVTSVTLMPCDSSSCRGYRTIKVGGTLFKPESVFQLYNNGLFYGKDSSYNNSPDAQLTGGNGSTEIIMDYYNLGCGKYDVSVTIDSSMTTVASPIPLNISCAK